MYDYTCTEPETRCLHITWQSTAENRKKRERNGKRKTRKEVYWIRIATQPLHSLLDTYTNPTTTQSTGYVYQPNHYTVCWTYTNPTTTQSTGYVYQPNHYTVYWIRIPTQPLHSLLDTYTNPTTTQSTGYVYQPNHYTVYWIRIPTQPLHSLLDTYTNPTTTQSTGYVYQPNHYTVYWIRIPTQPLHSLLDTYTNPTTTQSTGYVYQPNHYTVCGPAHTYVPRPQPALNRMRRTEWAKSVCFKTYCMPACSIG